MISVLSLFLLFSINAARADYSCQASYDQFNIPHIKFQSEQEYFYCFGFHHGKDRAWEMDYFRRIAEGRNAEVLGYNQLKNDLMMRLLDMPTLAQKIWRDFPQDKRPILEWYAQGVNKGFEIGKESQEFKDLRYDPEVWKPEDSLMVLLIQSFDQTKRTFFMDFEEERMKEHWGEKAKVLFDHDDVPWLDTILKAGEYPVTKTATQPLRKTGSYSVPRLWGQFPEVFGKETGSNNWVVAKEKSKSGNIMLANDPHLDLLTPMFWYWIHLKGPDREVIGASLPGVPTIPSGTNLKVAWGLTNAYINTADTVFVTEVPKDQKESFRPVVWVKLGFLKLPFFFKSFERLKSGHRVMPLELKNSQHPLVLRWTGFSLTPKDVLPMFDLPSVKDVQAMDQLLKGIGVPAWNFVFADKKEIGHRVIGKVYRMDQKNEFGVGKIPYSQISQETYLSSEEVPHVMNPKRHYVYTANNRHWPSDAAFYGGRGYSHSFRGKRIDEMLTSVDKHDVESFKQIQCDVLVNDAKYFVPKLARYLEDKSLASWNQIATDDSKELSLYRRLMDLIMEKWQLNEYALWRLLDHLDQKQQTELKQIYAQAKTDVKGRSWSELHLLAFSHLSKDGRWKFSPEIAGVGDNHTVNPGTSKWNEARGIYEQSNGASMRMIVEMQDKPKIYLALPGLNREYGQAAKDSPWLNWKNCQYAEVSY